MTGIRIWRTLGGGVVVGGLAVLAFALSVWGRGCDEESGDCFGVNWRTVTVEEIAGVDVHARAKGSVTPLHVAAWENDNPAVIKALVQEGADIEARDENDLTPLYWAANNNQNPAVIKTLIQAGADVGARGKKGGTPLDAAKLMNKNPAVVEALRAASSPR